MVTEQGNEQAQQTAATSHEDNSAGDENGDEKLGFFPILLSVFAAAIGVQNKKNLKKDFNAKGSIYIYAAAGVIFTVLFVLTVFFVVQMVLASAA